MKKYYQNKKIEKHCNFRKNILVFLGLEILEGENTEYVTLFL
jgi:hypothetical protein